EGAPRPYRVIPYRRNSKFTGRKALIESIKRVSKGNGHRRVALHGLGGSGKTQIALEYVHQLASKSDSDVFWVQGSGVVKFIEGFRAIAEYVRILPASAEGDQEQLLASIKRWLEGPDSGEEDFIGNNGPISKFSPQGQRGTLIFTTRCLRVASWQDCERIEVGKMDEDEAQAMFAKRFGSRNNLSEEDKAAITMILGSIHHVPLAIVGAAAFMTETRTPPSIYWTMFRGSDDHAKRLLSQPFCDIQREADMTESILATYFITFNRITVQMPLAADLLRLIAFFDRQNIPEELLSKCGLEGMDDPIKFRRAIGNLLGFSLITAAECKDKTFYELHRLVQLSLQVYLPTEALDQWRAKSLGVVARLFPGGVDGRRYVGSAYIPHAVAVTKDSRDPIAEELCFRLGQCFLEMGFYNDAEIQFRPCIELRYKSKEYAWAEQGLRRVILLGAVIAYQGKAEVAEKILRDLLVDIEVSFGRDNLIVLEAVDYLGIVLRDRGKYTESEIMHRRALEGREKILGADHPDTLTSANDLAILLKSKGNYSESEMMNRRALKGYEKIHGPDHPYTLTSVGNLATVLQRQRKYNESETMNRRALEGREKILGADHPDTLTSANDLAILLESQGNYSESEMMNRRALKGYEKIHGPDHPYALTSVSNLATVLERQGKYTESETMRRRALEGRQRTLGPDHPKTRSSARKLAALLRSQGFPDDS
ncbi:unnamed protein product, partial [Tuber aestivum]